MNRLDQLALEARDRDLRERLFITCEPRCLMAHSPVCRCACQGRFHGKARGPQLRLLPVPEQRTA